MSDAVLAAIIAAMATLCATFLQLRTTLAREADARSRGQPVSRRRSRLPIILLGVMLLASAVGGFALSQWLGLPQRSSQAAILLELREQVTRLNSAIAALDQMRPASAIPTPTQAPVTLEFVDSLVLPAQSAPTAVPAAAPVAASIAFPE